MIKLNLTPQNKQEELILNYLQNNVSESLADKINNGTPFEKDGRPLLNKKTLSGFMKYACEEARKLAEKGSNSACIDDVSLHSFAVYKMLSILIIIINVLLTIDNNCIYNLGILSHWYCANLSYGFPEEFLQNIAIFRNDIVRKEK